MREDGINTNVPIGSGNLGPRARIKNLKLEEQKVPKTKKKKKKKKPTKKQERKNENQNNPKNHAHAARICKNAPRNPTVPKTRAADPTLLKFLAEDEAWYTEEELEIFEIFEIEDYETYE